MFYFYEKHVYKERFQVEFLISQAYVWILNAGPATKLPTWMYTKQTMHKGSKFRGTIPLGWYHTASQPTEGLHTEALVKDLTNRESSAESQCQIRTFLLSYPWKEMHERYQGLPSCTSLCSALDKALLTCSCAVGTPEEGIIFNSSP